MSWTWLAPVVVFGLVVFVHELGHFIAAKLAGVYAPVFSLGWGSRAWGIKLGETDYRLSWLPIGGFVRMASRDDETMSRIEGGGEAPLPEGEAGVRAMAESGHVKGFNPVEYDPEGLAPFGPRPVPEDRWFESKPLASRLFIMVAGVTMNAILTLVVAIALFAFYGRPYLSAVLSEVVPGKPAAAAGLLAGDSVAAVNGTAVRDFGEFVDRISASPGVPVVLDVRRAGAALAITVTPERTSTTDPLTGEPLTVGRIGATPVAATHREPLPLARAVVEGWDYTWMLGGTVLKIVKGLVLGRVSVRQLGGPIAIAKSSVQAARSGFESLLALIALLSINIAILNLLPIPLLDGGQIIMNVAETVKGSAFSVRTREMIMRAGLVAVLLIFVVVMWNDVLRLIGVAG
ncbi:MAG: RIP metalloprotease RseP [Gemmatimonadetes bacterium]|nr:RIP metalloprotease RseP [Gemmatimonadota bacterium]